MHDPVAALDIPTPILLDEAPKPRGHPVIAWLAIILLVGIVVVRTDVAPIPQDAETKDRFALRLMEMQARYVVSAASLAGQSNPSFYQQVQALNVGPLPQRLRFVVLAGELAGPKEALAQLDRLKQLLAAKGIKPTPADAAIEKSLVALYSDYEAKHLDAPSVSGSQRELLRSELGWFGELALAPAGGPNPAEREVVLFRGAHRTMLTFFLVFAGVGLLGVLGFVGLLVLLVFLFTGRARSGLGRPSAHGALYAETFAVYLALFLLCGFGASLLPLPGARLLLSGAAALLSLTALAWPVLRGVPWRQVRQEIGLTLGRNPLLEPLVGVGTYAMALPLLVLAALLVVIVLLLQKALHGGGAADGLAPDGPLLHPIVQVLRSPDWGVRLQVLFLAAVVAPLVEETMFRGVFYRHVRDATGCRLGLAASTLFSATLVGFIFAILHPYGWIGVPTLMALAFAFALVREWRGTLLPAMVAHGMQNALVTLLFIFLLSD